jgi:hypothetical protein
MNVKIPFSILLLLFLFENFGYSQQTKIHADLYDGILIAGFVDGGGFTNFTGPNINMTRGNSRFILGALPSLRYKRDNSTPKNSFVTPHLGIGFTYSHKIWAIQLPLYYNGKTATEDGNWNIGLGIGLRINYIHSNKERAH